MDSRRIKDMVVRAVRRSDHKTISAIVDQLFASERANEILRAKGYGTSGMQIDQTAAQVPAAHPRSE